MLVGNQHLTEYFYFTSLGLQSFLSEYAWISSGSSSDGFLRKLPRKGENTGREELKTNYMLRLCLKIERKLQHGLMSAQLFKLQIFVIQKSCFKKLLGCLLQFLLWRLYFFHISCRFRGIIKNEGIRTNCIKNISASRCLHYHTSKPNALLTLGPKIHTDVFKSYRLGTRCWGTHSYPFRSMINEYWHVIMLSSNPRKKGRIHR